jgi:preprotein translocase subunit SecG
MFDTLLAIHIIVAILLITVVLLQKSNTDGLASLTGGGGNSGFVNAKTAANFLTKLTIGLAVMFIVNSIVLAKLSTKSHTSVI